MNVKSLFFLIAALALAPAAVSAQQMNLQKVLDQINAASPKFHDVQADISVDLYTAVVQEHEQQQGTTAFRRQGSSMEMVTSLKAANGQPVAQLLYRNGELDYYQPPPAGQETIFSGGSNRGQYDALLATGFGATANDLTSQWTITFQGMETIDGHETAKLDLVSKQASIRDNFSHLTVWIDLARDISLKQVMVQPSGDSRTVTYSNVRYNTHLPDSLFTLRVPKGTPVTRR
ncbi:MAG: outer membrane lipoprotein-sorting protein [Acidobacteriaceae bacterium]|jgi:outer membrane lipoprotein-sorting protein